MQFLQLTGKSAVEFCLGNCQILGKRTERIPNICEYWSIWVFLITNCFHYKTRALNFNEQSVLGDFIALKFLIILFASFFLIFFTYFVAHGREASYFRHITN